MMERRAARIKRGAVGGAAVAVCAALLHWVVLVFHLPVFPDGWVWRFQESPPPRVWPLLLVAAIAFFVIRQVLRTPNCYGRKLAALIALGFVLQHGFALLEGRGLEGIRSRITDTGHAEFAVDAVRQASLYQTLCNYEQLLDDNQLCVYAQSKPPGQLAFYMLSERLCNGIYPEREESDRWLERFRTFACFFWPGLSFLVLVPLFFFTKTILDAETGILACILYLSIPSVNLIPLHTDQVLFPTFCMTALLLATLAHRRGSLWLAVLAGGVIYTGLFCTFALIFTLPLAAAVCLAGSYPPGGERHDLRRFAATGCGVLAGILIVDLLFRMLFGYDIVARYRGAVAFHTAWLHWQPTLWKSLHFANINTLEFILWTGTGVSLLALLNTLRSIERVYAGRIEVAPYLSLALLAVLFFLTLFGRTEGEVARLWLFLVPSVCVLAAHELRTRFRADWTWMLPLLLCLQFGTILFLKLHQDFH